MLIFLSSFYSKIEKNSRLYNIMLLGDINLDVSPGLYQFKPVVNYKNMLSLALAYVIYDFKTN